MKGIGLLLLISAIVSTLHGCSSKERVLEDSVWSPSTNEYVRVTKDTLHAGRRQELSISYDHPMATVVGKLGQLTVPFTSHEDGMRWTASIRIPKYEDLDDPKVLRVYAKMSDGEVPVSNLHKRVPASWLGRGEDGKFPKIPGPDYNEYPISK